MEDVLVQRLARVAVRRAHELRSEETDDANKRTGLGQDEKYEVKDKSEFRTMVVL